MSGNKNSGRKPPAQPLAFPVKAEIEPVEIPRPLVMSQRAEAIWPGLVAAARSTCDLTAADSSALGLLAELLATREALMAEKATPGFSALSETGRQIVRMERQNAAAILPHLASFRLDPRTRLRVKRQRDGSAERGGLSKFRGSLEKFLTVPDRGPQ